jgi:hypothetical protein
LGRSQRRLNLAGASSDPTLATARAQQALDRAETQSTPSWRRCMTEYGDGVTSVQVGPECEQRGVVLPQGTRQSIEVPLPGPDQALMRACQDLDRLDRGGDSIPTSVLQGVGNRPMNRSAGARRSRTSVELLIEPGEQHHAEEMTRHAHTRACWRRPRSPEGFLPGNGEYFGDVVDAGHAWPTKLD